MYVARWEKKRSSETMELTDNVVRVASYFVSACEPEKVAEAIDIAAETSASTETNNNTYFTPEGCPQAL